MKLSRPLSVRTFSGLLLAAAVGAVALGVALARQPSRATAAVQARSATSGIVVVDTRLGLEGAQAAGTGMVLTSTGEVLTNNHVIAGATSIEVAVPQTGRRYTATVVGYDVGADTAVLKLKNASGLATVTTGDSAKLVPGRAVRAIGNAGGTGSLTSARGTITGLDRTITVGNDRGGTERLTGLIETDAALQPGDSGGPLLDASGRVIGMDTAASTAGGDFVFETGAADGFAIPIDRALAVAAQIEAGHSSATVHIGATAFLGIDVASPDSYGFGDGTRSQGAIVAGVVPGSPADRAGLSQGDVITAIAGHAVASPGTIVSQLLQRKPGSRISLSWSDQYGSRRTATVTLVAGPPQ